MNTSQEIMPAASAATGRREEGDTFQRYRQWVLPALILLACAGLRAGMAWRSEGMARDGYTYIRMARQWWHDPAGVVHGYPYHPGYPATVATVHALLALPDSQAAWQAAGMVVSGLAGVLAMLGTWFWCRMAFGRRTACITTLLFGMTRKWSALGADVLSDSLALCAMVWSLVVGVWAMQAMRERPGRGLLLIGVSGLLGGVGYCVRPEAAVVPCLVVAMLVIDQLRRGRWQRGLLAIGVAAGAAAALAIPYMLLIGDVTKKKRLLDMLNPAGLAAALPTGLEALVRQLFEAMHPVLGGLLCVWVVVALAGRLRRTAGGRDGTHGTHGAHGGGAPGPAGPMSSTGLVGSIDCPPAVAPRRPTGAWMLLVLVCWGMMMLALRRTAGYMSHRHVMFLGIVLLPLAGQALVILVDAARRRLGQWRAFVPPSGAVAVLVGAGLAVHALHDPLYEGRGLYHQAAEHLAAQAAPGATILVEGKAMEFALREARSDWQVLQLEGPDLSQWLRDAGLAPQAAPQPGEPPLAAAAILPVMNRNHADWVVIHLPGGPAGQAWLAQSGLADLYAQSIPTSQDELHILQRSSHLSGVPATLPAGAQPAATQP